MPAIQERRPTIKVSLNSTAHSLSSFFQQNAIKHFVKIDGNLRIPKNVSTVEKLIFNFIYSE
jgi:hypothetical protein